MFKLSTRQQQTTQKVSNYNKFLPLQWQFMNSKQTEKKTATLHGQVQEQENSAENTVKCAQTEINNEH